MSNENPTQSATNGTVTSAPADELEALRARERGARPASGNPR